MSVGLYSTVIRGSTAIFELSFFDEEGNSATPASSVDWTVTNESGTIVIASGSVSPAETVSIVVSGLSLRIVEHSKKVLRRLIIETTYNSTKGLGLPLRDVIEFYVQE